MSKQNLMENTKLKICMFGQKRIPSREGGVEVVVEELATQMAQQGHSVTCYNRGGHHVSGSAFDAEAPCRGSRGFLLVAEIVWQKNHCYHPRSL